MKLWYIAIEAEGDEYIHAWKMPATSARIAINKSMRRNFDKAKKGAVTFRLCNKEELDAYLKKHGLTKLGRR